MSDDITQYRVLVATDKDVTDVLEDALNSSLDDSAFLIGSTENGVDVDAVEQFIKDNA